MKYFFAGDSKGGAHIIVAESIKSAKAVMTNADLTATTLYELKEDTFQNEGFLVSVGSF